MLSLAGSDRLRCSRAFASSITASTNSGGNVLVNTPIATRSGNRSRAAFTIRVTPATQKIIVHYGLRKRRWALIRAGIPRESWNVINRTGDDFFEELLSGQLRRNGLGSDGYTFPGQ